MALGQLSLEITGPRIAITNTYVTNKHWAVKREVLHKKDRILLENESIALRFLGLREILGENETKLNDSKITQKLPLEKEFLTRYELTDLTSEISGEVAVLFISDDGQSAWFQKKYIEFLGVMVLWGDGEKPGFTNTDMDRFIMPVIFDASAYHKNEEHWRSKARKELSAQIMEEFSDPVLHRFLETEAT